MDFKNVNPHRDFPVISNPHNPLNGKSYEEVKEAIEIDGYLLQYVRNQTEEICKLAVQQNKDAVQYVSDEFIHLLNK